MDYCDYCDAHIIANTDELVILVDRVDDRNSVYWSFDEPKNFLSCIECISGSITMDFVPKTLVDELIAHRFSIYAEYIDYFNNNLSETAKHIDHNSAIESINHEDKYALEQMSSLCVEQTRGFRYELVDWYKNWAKENCILAIRRGSEIVGYCCVSIYAGNTIVWVRRLAVSPQWQGKGIGEALLKQAMAYGIKNGASRAFLHVDSSNKAAISLYSKYGFCAVDREGQIIMQKNTS